jgi:nitrate reductase NapAB chaperone NapD
MLPPKTQLDTTAEINHSYIILIWREQEDEDIIDILRTQLNQLKDGELLQWNPRGRFVVVVTDKDSSSVISEALKIYEIMWMEYKAVNTVVLKPDFSGY